MQFGHFLLFNFCCCQILSACDVNVDDFWPFSLLFSCDIVQKSDEKGKYHLLICLSGQLLMHCHMLSHGDNIQGLSEKK